MPVFKAGVIPLSHLITIVSSLSKNIFLMTGDEGYSFFKKDKRIKTINISQSASTFFIGRIFNYLSFQVRMSLLVLKRRKQIDIFIFFLAGETLLLPILTAYLLRKKVLLMFASSTIKIHISNNDPLAFFLKIIQFYSCMFADRLIVYADCLIGDYSLERWSGKIVIAGEHYINVDSFKIKKEYLSRECIVGYVGRFSEEKGILNLLYAIPDVVFKKPNIKFLLIGDGALRQIMDQFILDNNLSDKVILPGWVPHDLLADYLNQMKVLVIASDTEGVPNNMLEAMACGTPVLATPVGGIPSIIIDGETGFILENNSPLCIASNIIRRLEDEKTVNVIGNAYQVIRNKFQFEKQIENFKNIFDDVTKKPKRG